MTAIRQRLMMLCAAIAVACIAMPCATSSAYAAALHRDGFDAVPPDTVRIDYPLKISNAEFSTTNPGYRVSSVDDIWGLPANVVIYGRPVEEGIIDGSFTLLWRDVGTDADDDAIDLKLTVSDVEARTQAPNLLLIDDGSFLSLDATTASLEGKGVRMDIACSVAKSGTDTPAEGNLLVGFTDIDVTNEWPEQVELVSGFGSDVWVPQTNFLDISDDAARFTATKSDSDTYDSGFVATAKSAGFSIRWQGEGCGTFFLQPFNTANQSIMATAGKGGSITDPGTTFIRWKNNKTYAISPDAHHRIKDVLVDGASIGITSEYTFMSVTENHTIEAVFEAMPTHTVEFMDGFGAVIKTQEVEEGSAAAAPEEPHRDGWAFIGWDEDFSSITENLTVTALWEPMISVRVPTLVACAIMADGTVIAPTGYAIENLSPVAVTLASAETTNMPNFGSYDLESAPGTIIHSYAAESDIEGETLVIQANEAAGLTWRIGGIRGEKAQNILLAALSGPVRLCGVTFTFKAA